MANLPRNVRSASWSTPRFYPDSIFIVKRGNQHVWRGVLARHALRPVVSKP